LVFTKKTNFELTTITLLLPPISTPPVPAIAFLLADNAGIKTYNPSIPVNVGDGGNR